MMKKMSFLEELLEKGNIGGLVDSITLRRGDITVFNSPVQVKTSSDDQAFICSDVPDYMKVNFCGKEKQGSEKSVATFEGSYIDLTQYEDLDGFLRAKLSSKRISRLKAYKRTLEHVFPISYQYYYGNIKDDTYDLLMDALKDMISKRFDEKKLEHLALMEWDAFRENGKKLIKEKRGALIVVQHGNHPIHISFNYVWENLVFGYVRGFDLDYSKFYLGYIDILIQLDWCFQNEFKIYDLLRENLEYKLRFADHTYLYRSHVVFPKSPIHKRIVPILHWVSLSLKFDLYYPAIGKLKGIYHSVPFLPKRQPKTAKTVYYFDEVSEAEHSQMEKNLLEPINLDLATIKNLKRAAYHFLYTTKDQLEDLNVYKDFMNPQVFIFKGRKIVKKVHLQSTQMDTHGEGA
jgi:hypothetical protein